MIYQFDSFLFLILYFQIKYRSGNHNKSNDEGIVRTEKHSVRHADYDWCFYLPRGHISSSIIAYKNCGFLIIAGVTNNDTSPILSSIVHYNIVTNEWTTIGNLPFQQKTPVCDIIGNKLFCLGGSKVVKIEVD